MGGCRWGGAAARALPSSMAGSPMAASPAKPEWAQAAAAAATEAEAEAAEVWCTWLREAAVGRLGTAEARGMRHGGVRSHRSSRAASALLNVGASEKRSSPMSQWERRK